MNSSSFHFKRFSIVQNNAAMKVGTDGVLLGAWANIDNAKTILDIGTGTGLIALMLAQRCDAEIDAIDINSDACTDAQQNFLNSEWNNRIRLHNKSIQDYTKLCGKKYDCIVCNPPFFSNSQKTSNNNRTTARHDDKLTIAELFNNASALLTDNGTFQIIYPFTDKNILIETARLSHIFPTNIIHIKPTPTKEPKRVLISFSKIKILHTITETLIIETNGRHMYSDEYKNLTKDFYLKF